MCQYAPWPNMTDRQAENRQVADKQIWKDNYLFTKMPG